MATKAVDDKHLDSVQSELRGIAFMCDAHGMRSDAELYDSLNGVISGLRAALPKWISVADRLPERGVAVHCWAPGWAHGLDGVLTKNDEWITGGLEANPGVTHWMPLPPPPDVGG